MSTSKRAVISSVVIGLALTLGARAADLPEPGTVVTLASVLLLVTLDLPTTLFGSSRSPNTIAPDGQALWHAVRTSPSLMGRCSRSATISP